MKFFYAITTLGGFFFTLVLTSLEWVKRFWTFFLTLGITFLIGLSFFTGVSQKLTPRKVSGQNEIFVSKKEKLKLKSGLEKITPESKALKEFINKLD